ncbi:MAG: glutathione S-transferase N-terminal domain-containing protein [Myxococcales bacterium]
MELFFSPLACSAASRIALYESGQTAAFTRVDTKTRRTDHGEDYLAVHPLGMVPALRLDDGRVLTENAAILQFLAERVPEAQLAPVAGMERALLWQWLCFIGTELHKTVFTPLLDAKAPAASKEYALALAETRLALLERHLTDRTYLLERFSVADAYLVVILGWTQVTPIELAKYPAVAAYVGRLRKRPSVAKALAEERELYTQAR